MPIYEYHCEECGENFEKLFASFRSTEKADCPKCGSSRIKKMLSNFSACGSSSSKNDASYCPRAGGT